VRVSSDRQDVDLSVSAQLKALREYAARNSLKVVREFIDEAESGRTVYRPQFREMISLAKRNERPFDVILVYKYSRFARSREDSIVYKALLKKCGVQLTSITEPFDDTPTGRLMQAIIECIDEFYSENLGEEVTRGMRESASRGFYLSCHPPYGYKKVRVNDGGKERTKLDIEESQSCIVASVFDKMSMGKGLTEVTKELNSKGIASPTGKGWGKTSLYKILGNEVYTGTLVWGHASKRGLPPVRVENAFPAIVDRKTFQQVQGLLEQRSFAWLHPRRASSPYLLSGIAHCGHCGKSLIGSVAKSGEFSYYVCGTLTKKGAGSCSSRYLNTRKLESMVVNKIKEHILTPENLTGLVELVNEELNSNSEVYQKELSNIDTEIADVTRRLERLFDSIETGKVIPDDLGPRIRELRGRQEKLQARKGEVQTFMLEKKTEVPSTEEVVEYVADLRNILEDGSFAERKAFIRSFVKEVKITGDKALLTYTIPMSPRRLLRETTPVLAIVHDGGPKGTFAKPIESFFELSIGTGPSLVERDYHAKKES
ncbi:MAG: recombinase family protein, partial [Candidatus Tectomicrobia bacterium]|nr:recombinase family protein [Candidatus Tectomicrobia bacterium]